MTTQDRHENLASAEYLDSMALAWRVVSDLHKAGLPVERLVWRARALYHAAWKDEKRRQHVT